MAVPPGLNGQEGVGNEVKADPLPPLPMAIADYFPALVCARTGSSS